MLRTEIIERLGDGYFVERLVDELISVSDEVVMTGKKGSLVLTFGVECPKTDLPEPFVTITPSFKRNLPARRAASASFYISGGDFHTSPASQYTLPADIFEPTHNNEGV